MEGQNQFQTALKKTVVMFKTITGKDLTEREASLFINLLDLTEGYLTPYAVSVTGTAQSPEALGIAMKELAQAGQVLGKATDNCCNVAGAEPGQNKSAQTGLDGFADDVYIAQPITTSSRNHIQGYDWQIAVLSRAKDASDSYVVHFAYKPTQKQFEEHFVKFIAQTHYVHVNEWNSAWVDWMAITNLYEIAHLSKPEQDHDPRWEQADMAYRVRHFDRETGELSFLYLKTKPTGAELAKYHHTKGFAVVQSKVA